MNWSWLQRLLSETPIGLIGLVLLALMIAAASAASWLRRRWFVGPEGEERDNSDQEGLVISAVLALLGLLLGFTFSLAVDRYEFRRGLVLEEANAIGTAYLRSQLLPEPHRAKMTGLLTEYTANRLRLARLERGRTAELLARNDALITELWTETVAVWPSIRGFDFSSAYVDSMNLVIDLDTSRKAARLARVPAEVFALLFVYAVAAAGVLGYVLSSRRVRRSSTALLVLLCLTLLLIVDIDRPVGGGVSEEQLPMELLQGSLKSWRPEVFGGGAAAEVAAPPAGPAR
ncbi:MAG: hypothetical protein ABW042_06815 [Phenylobacterium sp.]